MEELWYDSNEYEELKAKFSVELPEDVTNWDSYWNLMQYIYEQGYKAGKSDK